MCSLRQTHPTLCEEWDYEKNENTPDDVSYGSTKQVWWKCQHGHSFCSSPNQRTRYGERDADRGYRECPYCANELATSGEYSFQTEHPELMEEWDWEENAAAGLNPDELLPNSGKKVHWICKKNPQHKWIATISNRVSGGRKRRGSGCPYCDGKAFKEGITDLATLYPNIAEEWDYELNDDVPEHVHAGSTKNAHWICPQGHRYEMPVGRRTNMGCGCSICAGKKVIYETSLACLYPDIAAEWDYDKNELTPDQIAPKSSKKFWWKCPHNPKHVYEASIASRTYNNTGCPFCSGRRVLPEESFGAIYPDLLKEWDYDKNAGLSPFSLAPKSRKKVWWKCRNGHSWKTHVHVRADGHGCPECKKGTMTSFAEQVFFLACQKAFPEYEVKNRYKTDFGNEIDIFIPDLMLGIEPGNWVLHKEKYNKDKNKRDVCKSNGIRLVTVYDEYKEEQLPFLDDCYVERKFFGSGKNYLIIRDILQDLFKSYKSIDPAFWNDSSWDDIACLARKQSNRTVPDVSRSLAAIAPEVASEWHPTLNGDLTPEDVYAKGTQSAWWICPKGHEYQAPIYDRVQEKRGCGICSKRTADPRYNTISKLYPDFAEMFDESNDILPDTITPFNARENIVWKCPNCQGTFEKTPNAMFQAASTKCPICGERLLHTPLNEIDF